MLLDIGPVPNWLAWIFGGVAIVALVVAIVALAPLIQMIMGAPKLKVEYIGSPGVISGLIANQPVQGKRMSRWVRRETAQGLTVLLTISKMDQEESFTMTARLIKVPGIHNERVTRMDLAASGMVLFAVANRGVDGHVRCIDDAREREYILEPGNYLCVIRLFASHCQHRR